MWKQKNDVYFAIKGKRLDGNRFVHEALKKKSSLVIVNRINKNYPAIDGNLKRVLSRLYCINNTKILWKDYSDILDLIIVWFFCKTLRN